MKSLLNDSLVISKIISTTNHLSRTIISMTKKSISIPSTVDGNDVNTPILKNRYRIRKMELDHGARTAAVLSSCVRLLENSKRVIFYR